VTCTFIRKGPKRVLLEIVGLTSTRMNFSSAFGLLECETKTMLYELLKDTKDCFDEELDRLKE